MWFIGYQRAYTRLFKDPLSERNKEHKNGDRDVCMLICKDQGRGEKVLVKKYIFNMAVE